MSNRSTLNVALTPRLQRFVQAKVASGRFHSPSEVVCESLRLLEAQDEKTALREVKRKIASGLAQANRGKLRNGEDVFAEQRRRLVGKLRARSSVKA